MINWKFPFQFPFREAEKKEMARQKNIFVPNGLKNLKKIIELKQKIRIIFGLSDPKVLSEG